MAAYVALLRAINLGKTRKVPMPELRGLAEGLGYRDVRSHIQSGNLIFATADPAPTIVDALETAIRDRFGFDVPVILRTAGEMAAVARSHPFAADEEDPAKLHVVFYAEALSTEAVDAVLARDLSPDRVTVSGREAFVHYPEGAGRSRLNLQPLGPGTARNWRVVQALAQIISGD